MESLFTLHSLTSVSYTHLDVYKRQIYNTVESFAVRGINGVTVVNLLNLPYIALKRIVLFNRCLLYTSYVKTLF